MKKETTITAMGYRVPRMLMKDAMLAILTLGIKKPKHVKEEAKLLLYTIDDLIITINEETRIGTIKELGTKQLESADERDQILKKATFIHGQYVYHIDKETIEENRLKLA